VTTADDLKQIAGIGPKLEKVLNGQGISSISQIAAWSEPEIAWIEDYLQFKGRIGRDGWIEQAKALQKK
jgi:NADH-quinone oxidoreductase subunit E